MIVLDAKVVVLGSQGVGKTSVVMCQMGKGYHKHVSPTIGASFFSCNTHVDDHRLRLQVWDTAGQERFRSMAPMYYRNANAAFLVFDITSYESYMGMKTWAEELRQNVDAFVYVCILGNKCDLEKHREVKREEAQEYANSLCAVYVETSAQNNTGIEDAFLAISRGLIKMNDDNSLENERSDISGNSKTLALNFQQESNCCR